MYYICPNQDKITKYRKMKEQNYYSGKKVILIKQANGLEIGTELTINERCYDKEYNCTFLKNGEEKFGNFFEDEFRLKTKYDELDENEKSSD